MTYGNTRSYRKDVLWNTNRNQPLNRSKQLKIYLYLCRHRDASITTNLSTVTFYQQKEKRQKSVGIYAIGKLIKIHNDLAALSSYLSSRQTMVVRKQKQQHTSILNQVLNISEENPTLDFFQINQFRSLQTEINLLVHKQRCKQNIDNRQVAVFACASTEQSRCDTYNQPSTATCSECLIYTYIIL